MVIRLLPLLPVTPDVDRPSTFQARFLDRAGRCAGAFGLGEVGFECCQAGWRAGIRPRLRRIGGRAVAGARPAGISRVVRRCRGSRRVGGARGLAMFGVLERADPGLVDPGVRPAARRRSSERPESRFPTDTGPRRAGICLSSLPISLPISVSVQRMCSRPSGMPLRWEA